MWRALVFLGLICLAAYGAVWLANNPETIAVTWAGREYSSSLAVGVVGLLAAAILLSLILGAIRYVFTLPTTVGRARKRRRQSKGYSSLSRGIVAVGAGDITAARRHASEAEKLLGNDPLALLLKAQAAQASGNREAAEATFRDMSEKPETRILGLRGLYLEARRRGDLEAARRHAEEAARIAPAIGWASDAVLEGLSTDGDWTGAVRMVERRTSLGLVDRTTSRRQRAVLLTAEAMAKEARDPDGALASAQQAVKLAPDLVPAAGLAARLLSRRGDLKRAAKTIETAWTAMPHPELAAAYLNLRPGDSATDRLHRAETLARLSSWSGESRFAIARAAIESRELPRAREVLRPLLEDEGRPTVRLCMMMAEIEGRGGNSGGAREWLARAARAPRDKAWIADGLVSETWAPVSPVTGRLDAFRWETPAETLGASMERDEITFDPPEPDAPEDLPALKLARPTRGSGPRGAETRSGEVAAGARPEVVEPPTAGGSEQGGTASPVSVASAPQPESEAAKPSAIGVAPSTAQPDGSAATTDAAKPSSALATAPKMPESASRGGSKPVVSASRQGDEAPGPETPKDPAPSSSAGPSRGAAPSRLEPAKPEAPAIPERPSAGSNAARTSAPNGSNQAARGASREPEPVIFPVPRAPDDPGLEGGTDRRQRFRLRV
ncbi:heme biosynthesis HemY N-terminal domain-containing protein [uncultured Enterovirga sp.]|uniref:heme biosynthesis HemY N-terminal domain-containing protein n=1 Tax=uncultured Enterovirga sp. TaxID=2026352 RepID=UPI0035C9E7A8